jgi:nitrous oxide reductase
VNTPNRREFLKLSATAGAAAAVAGTAQLHAESEAAPVAAFKMISARKTNL